MSIDWLKMRRRKKKDKEEWIKKNGRKLYKTIQCLYCGYVYRTPIYTKMTTKLGYSNIKRKETDRCPKCTGVMFMDSLKEVDGV